MRAWPGPAPSGTVALYVSPAVRKPACCQRRSDSGGPAGRCAVRRAGEKQMAMDAVRIATARCGRLPRLASCRCSLSQTRRSFREAV